MRERIGLVSSGVAAAALLFVLAAGFARAQEAVQADPSHYQVALENDQVRALKIHYGPHEKGAMHTHPAAVIVHLTDGRLRATPPNGKSFDYTTKAGDVRWAPAAKITLENLGDQPYDAIMVELKR